MSIFYWMGSRSGDVMDNRNWSTVDLTGFGGITGQSGVLPHAQTIPGSNSKVILKKTTIPGISFSYPIYAPTGTMGISGGSTCAALYQFIVDINYDKGIGGPGAGGSTLSGQYLNLFSSFVNIQKGGTNGHTYAYNLNLLHNPVGLTESFVKIVSRHPIFDANIKGRGFVETFEPAVPPGQLGTAPKTFGNYYFTNGFSGGIGPFYNWQGAEKVYLNKDTIIDADYDLFNFAGAYTEINISKGFNAPKTSPLITSYNLTANQKDTNYPNQLIHFVSEEIGGLSGGFTGSTTPVTSLSHIHSGGIRSLNNIYGHSHWTLINHSVDFKYFLASGRTHIGNGEAKVRIFEGSIGQCEDGWHDFTVWYPDTLTILDPSSGYGLGTLIGSGIGCESYDAPLPFKFGPGVVLKLVVADTNSNYWEKLGK